MNGEKTQSLHALFLPRSLSEKLLAHTCIETQVL